MEDSNNAVSVKDKFSQLLNALSLVGYLVADLMLDDKASLPIYKQMGEQVIKVTKLFTKAINAYEKRR